jgi:uncharacterized protein YgbK (DUF1537 family)
MKTNLLILADDLTGSLDTGVQFAKNGIDTDVFPSFEVSRIPVSFSSSVIVINTNTRHASKEEAGSIVTTVTKSFKNFSYYYKKTDSCLRGNIGAELEAFFNTANNARLPFVPAFPALNRTTLDGCQYLDGKPIHESSMADDLLNPITESFIPSIIGRQSAVPAVLVKKGGIIPKQKDTKEILVFDGEKLEDLRDTAKILFEKDMLKISAGCAGFAQALMEILPLEKKNKENSFKPMAKLPILTVSSSLHPVSINQIKRAQEDGVAAFSLPDERIAEPLWINTEEAQTITANCGNTLLQKRIAILGTKASFGTARTYPDKDTQSISLALGRTVKKIIEKTGPIHLLIFGGDTLMGITKTLRYDYIKPLEEIQSGIVLAKALPNFGFRQNGLLITKAGSFGDEDLIFSVNEYFSEQSS